MLNQIRVPAAQASGPSTPTNQSSLGAPPLPMLLECHERIRHFVAMAARLAETPSRSEELPAEEICRAAESLVRYFTVALPLHEADENQTIFPRLHAAAPAGEIVAKSLEAMVSQHHAIDELLQSLVPLWQAVQSQPVELPQLAPELRSLSQRLRMQMTIHLAMEEDNIFPAFEKLLSPALLGEIEAEMVARRKEK